MGSIKDKVAIVGMGCTRFGEHWDLDADDLIVEATYEALEDAGIGLKDIQAAWAGTRYTGITALRLSDPLKLQYLPVTRVENLCASGAEAIRGAAYAVAAGACDIALAVGFEKLKDSGLRGLPSSPIKPGPIEEYMYVPAYFAMLANGYFDRYGLSPEEGKQLLARIAVKNHHNGTLAPKAQFRQEITLEQAVNAPMIAAPLGLFDCCAVSDGAAAAILVRADMARKFRDDPVYIKALAVCVGPRDGLAGRNYDWAHVEENARAARIAYEQAGIGDPIHEISVAEIYDCFSIHELVLYEDLGWIPRGSAKEHVGAGTFALDGELPVNTDGGMKCFGHPIGATGIRMMYEVYKQLQGRAERRQVKNPSLGLTQISGGAPGSAVAAVYIAGN
jgi:acetyl-CoA C-acetyltransferase